MGSRGEIAHAQLRPALLNGDLRVFHYPAITASVLPAAFHQ